MENFFNWMSQPVPKDEVIVWFNVHNMNYEKIELYGDIFKSLNHIISDTYLGNEDSETKIVISDEDKKSHFDWCWYKNIENFEKENIRFKIQGDHKTYMEEFLDEIFYDQKEEQIIDNIHEFMISLFDEEKSFTESDLTILTEIYKVFEKNRI